MTTAALPRLPSASSRRLSHLSVAVLGLASAAFPSLARAQATPPVSESVVVTATAAPQEESDVGSAATVITRRDIEADVVGDDQAAERLVEMVEAEHTHFSALCHWIFCKLPHSPPGKNITQQMKVTPMMESQCSL